MATRIRQSSTRPNLTPGRLPRQDGCTVGNIANYAFDVSADGKTWGDPAVQGEFGNIKASPEQPFANFTKPVPGRFFKFVALRGADGIPVAIAELGVTGKLPLTDQ